MASRTIRRIIRAKIALNELSRCTYRICRTSSQPVYRLLHTTHNGVIYIIVMFLNNLYDLHNGHPLPIFHLKEQTGIGSEFHGCPYRERGFSATRYH